MSIANKLHSLKRLLATSIHSPEIFKSYLNNADAYRRGFEYASNWHSESYRVDKNQEAPGEQRKADRNQLFEYFRNNKRGPGIWKFEHYFEVYQRHFSKFVSKSVDVAEIGIYSGGSLYMWKWYFGDRSHIHGIDIEPACKTYERDAIAVIIGDQEDRNFWKNFKDTVSGIDVLIDDGGHSPGQQIVTLEEMLPHIRPGGVYLCEDVCCPHHRLISFASGLISELNRSVTEATGFQKCVHSIHIYPYLLVIEKQTTKPSNFQAPKYGSEWQPLIEFKT